MYPYLTTIYRKRPQLTRLQCYRKFSIYKQTSLVPFATISYLSSIPVCTSVTKMSMSGDGWVRAARTSSTACHIYHARCPAQVSFPVPSTWRHPRDERYTEHDTSNNAVLCNLYMRVCVCVCQLGWRKSVCLMMILFSFAHAVAAHRSQQCVPGAVLCDLTRPQLQAIWCWPIRELILSCEICSAKSWLELVHFGLSHELRLGVIVVIYQCTWTEGSWLLVGLAVSVFNRLSSIHIHTLNSTNWIAILTPLMRSLRTSTAFSSALVGK